MGLPFNDYCIICTLIWEIQLIRKASKFPILSKTGPMNLVWRIAVQAEPQLGYPGAWCRVVAVASPPFSPLATALYSTSIQPFLVCAYKGCVRIVLVIWQLTDWLVRLTKLILLNIFSFLFLKNLAERVLVCCFFLLFQLFDTKDPQIWWSPCNSSLPKI